MGAETSATGTGRAMVAPLAATITLALVLLGVGAPLHTEAAPMGILSFELTFTGEQAAAVLASWSAEARRAAWAVQALDTLFPLAYGRLGQLVARWAGSEAAARLWVAGALLDLAVENTLLDALLWGLPPTDLLAGAATAAAVVKFALLGLALGLAALSRRSAPRG